MPQQSLLLFAWTELTWGFTGSHGDLFALAVIAMAGVTLGMLKVFGRRPDREGVFAGALILVVTLVVLLFVTVGHLCTRGGAMGVVFFGTLSAGFLRATVEPKRWRRLAWIGWFVLTFWGADLCHLDGYVGNPRNGEWLAQRPTHLLASVRQVIEKAAKDQKGLVLSEGWIDDSWRTATGKDFPVSAGCQSGTTGRYWHTWFTGVYLLETYSCGIWCRGSPLESCADSLEIRRRPDPHDK